MGKLPFLSDEMDCKSKVVIMNSIPTIYIYTVSSRRVILYDKFCLVCRKVFSTDLRSDIESDKL